MSKQDSHFFNNFSLVLGILFAVTLGLLAFARYVGAEHQGQQVTNDPRYLESVKERIQPVDRVAIAGRTAAYETACAACHGAGIAGAPKTGDKAAWGPRIAQGKATLYKHAIEGYIGKAGVMPAKGGRADWSDDLIKQAVDHMLELNQ
jgi:cytochrome c5